MRANWLLMTLESGQGSLLQYCAVRQQAGAVHVATAANFQGASGCLRSLDSTAGSAPRCQVQLCGVEVLTVDTLGLM